MKKTIKILIILLLTFISLSMMSKVEAASASIRASKKNVTVGDSVTISVSFNAAAWNLKVSGTGISANSYVGNTDDAENSKMTKILKLDTSTEGTKTIKLTGDVSDGSTGATTTISKSVTVKVNKKQTTTTTNSDSNNKKNEDNKNTTKTDSTPTFTSVKETVYAKSKANVRSSYSTSSSIVGSLKVGDSVKRIGIGSNGWSKISYNGNTAYVSTSLITKTKPEEPKDEKENNKEEKQKQEEKKQTEELKLQLNSLEVKGYDLEPEFSKDIYEYGLNVENDIKKLEIEAISDDKNVVIEISGNESLQVGENNITITISKEKSKEKNIYTLKVNKANVEEKQVENVVTINQDLLNKEIESLNKKLRIREWTIRGIIIFVTVLIIIMFILRYYTTKEDQYDESDEDYEYVNIKQKFNEINKLVDKEDMIEDNKQDTQVDYDNVQYKIKRNKKTKGKHF